MHRSDTDEMQRIARAGKIQGRDLKRFLELANQLIEDHGEMIRVLQVCADELWAHLSQLPPNVRHSSLPYAGSTDAAFILATRTLERSGEPSGWTLANKLRGREPTLPFEDPARPLKTGKERSRGGKRRKEFNPPQFESPDFGCQDIQAALPGRIGYRLMWSELKLRCVRVQKVGNAESVVHFGPALSGKEPGLNTDAEIDLFLRHRGQGYVEGEEYRIKIHPSRPEEAE